LHASACRVPLTGPLLFVAITSPVGNFNLRKALRRGLWLMSTFPAQDRASYMFFVGKGHDTAEDEKVAQEIRQFGDVVQFDIADSYPNLAVKSVGAAAWMSVRLDTSKVRYWLKVEDFMSNNFREIDRLVGRLDKSKEQGERKPYYGGGMIFGGTPTLPDGRWGCPKRHCPYKTYPVTYAGGMYLLDSVAVHIVVSDGLPGLKLKDPYPIEDHYIANVLHKAGVKVTEEKKLMWSGGKPYGAPSVIKGDYLLCLDTEERPDLEEDEEGTWEGSSLILPPGTAILKAWYGDPDPKARWGSERGQDVTEIVQELKKKGSQIKAGGKGFGDPAPGTRKALLLKVSRKA